MATLTVPVFAPAASADIGLEPSNIGIFASIIYFGAMASSLLSGGLSPRYGAIRGTKKCVGPVGTVFLTCYPIWHRRSKATATGTTRHLFKYNYVRNSPPTRDWIIEPDFNPSCDTHAFSHLQTGATMLRRNKLDNYDAAQMYLWLCGRQEEMRYVGGVAWPMLDDMIGGQTEEVYGAPPSLSATPDAWRPEAPPI